MLLMKHYIGLDAHSATCTFVVLDEAGKMTHRTIVKTSETTLLGFLKTLPGEKILTVEESHVSQWVYVLLNDKVEKLIVCNPVHLGKKQGPKTDYRDAFNLAQALRGNFLKAVYHDESHWIQLRVLVSGYSDLVTEIVRTKNRLKAVFRFIYRKKEPKSCLMSMGALWRRAFFLRSLFWKKKNSNSKLFLLKT
jgi:hypothetical protein